MLHPLMTLKIEQQQQHRKTSHTYYNLLATQHTLQFQFNLVKSQNVHTNDDEMEKRVLSVQECIKTLFF